METVVGGKYSSGLLCGEVVTTQIRSSGWSQVSQITDPQYMNEKLCLSPLETKIIRLRTFEKTQSILLQGGILSLTLNHGLQVPSQLLSSSV